MALESMSLQLVFPFILVGLLAGCWQAVPAQLRSRWLTNWLSLLLVLILAKLGQLLLPFHYFNWTDLFWEIVGALEGIAITAILIPLVKKGMSLYKSLS